MFTREEALGGLPGRRAHALLYLIEARTARLQERHWEMSGLAALGEVGVAQAGIWSLLFSSDSPEGSPTDSVAEYRASRGHFRPRAIRELEVYAPRWASLVPPNPTLQAALAHLLAEKYRFTNRQVPGIRKALGLDEEPVRQAYERLYGQPLETIYAPHVSLAERLRWSLVAFGKRLNALPPFWYVLLIVLALGIPQAMLALPIAAASVGALPAIGLVLLGGGLSLVTVVGIAEAAARCGALRYGTTYFGTLVDEFLGRAGTISFIPMGLGFYLIVFLASLIGISVTLEQFTPIPAPVWAALTTAFGLYCLARGRRGLSLGVSIAAAAIILLLLGVIMLVAAGHVRLANLTRAAAPIDGRPPGLEHLIGVVLMGYFVEAFVVQCAKEVLPRDPGGRALIGGSVAGLGAIALLLCVWVLAVNGALPPEALVGQRGSVFEPLAQFSGPSVAMVGSILIVLLPGLVVLRVMLFGFGMIREWLPAPQRVVMQLPCGTGRLLVRRRGTPSSIGVTYLGHEEGTARLRLDVQRGQRLASVEIGVADRWESAQLGSDLAPELRRQAPAFTLQALAADDASAQLLVTAAPGVACEAERRGLHLPDLVDLAEEEWQLLNRLVRRGETNLEELAAELHQPPELVRRRLDGLVAAGLVVWTKGDGTPRCRPRFASRRASRLPVSIWEALDGKADRPTPNAETLGVRRWASHIGNLLCSSEPRRFLVAVSPIIALFLVAEWLLLRGRGSFTGTVAFVGVVTNTYLTGVIPLLLLLSSRCKGDVEPGVVLRTAGHPTLIGALLALYVAIPAYHGLVLWQAPWEQATALLTAVMAVGATLMMIRRGAFTPRAVVELRQDLRQAGAATYSLMANGKPLSAAVQMEYPEGQRECREASAAVPDLPRLRSITFSLPATAARELKLWSHRVTQEETSEPLPALAEVRTSLDVRTIDLGLCRGQALLPIPGGACQVTLTLPE